MNIGPIYWTDERRAKLAELFHAKKTDVEIGEAFGKTAAAVETMRKKMKLLRAVKPMEYIKREPAPWHEIEVNPNLIRQCSARFARDGLRLMQNRSAA